MIRAQRHPGRPENRRGAARAICALAAALLLLIVAGCGGNNGNEHESEGRSGTDGTPVPPLAGPAVKPVVQPAPKPTEPLPADASCVTAECHARFETSPHKHPAVTPGDCFVCHQQDQGGHVYPMLRAGNDTCTYCHDVVGAMAHTHVPVDEPGCLSCHQPHVSETKFLLARATIEDVCLQCHLPDRDPVPHSPYGEGECTACHRPHAADSQLLLRGGDGPAHCYQCHDETRREIRELTYVHAAVEGQCTDCHAAHAAPYDHALEQPMEQMCFSCHAPIEALATQSTHTHGAVSRELACANCHESHASGRPGLLVDQEGRLCLQCHDREIETSDGRMLANMAEELNQDFLHGPVETGECHQCHEVHGSEHTGLLTAAFTDAFYAPFDLAHFELCFNCHQSALVLEERTSTLTNFRDGERNLHYLHVHRERKGRTCRTCHVVHGSDLPNHMAESVPFEGSDWAMPIGYEPTATGGACTPGCHARETYEREPSGDALKSAPEGGAS